MFCECPCHQSYHEYYVKKFGIRRKLTITRNGAVHISITSPISVLISKKGNSYFCCSWEKTFNKLTNY